VLEVWEQASKYRVEGEVGRVVDFLERHSQWVLQEHGFDGPGQPNKMALVLVKAGTDRCLDPGKVQEQLMAVCQEMEKRRFAPTEIAVVRRRAAEAVYEDLAYCANVLVDDVDMKKQKTHRRRSTEAAVTSEGDDAMQVDLPDSIPSAVASGSGKTRPKVSNTVARIEQGFDPSNRNKVSRKILRLISMSTVHIFSFAIQLCWKI
jgi:hypothetical protein